MRANRRGAALLLLLCGCRHDDSSYAAAGPSLEDRICQVDARLRRLVAPSAADRPLRPILDSLRQSAGRGGSDPLSHLHPVLHPEDADLVPSLAWERGRAGCVPLCLFLRAANPSPELLLPAFLPGHLVLRRPGGDFVEPLRGGILRTRKFYDSAFDLDRRPYYREIRADSNAILASLLVHAGILEWRRGRMESARSAFTVAATLCPGLPEAEGNLGLVLIGLGRIDSARPRLARALEGDPSNPRALRILDSLEFHDPGHLSTQGPRKLIRRLHSSLTPWLHPGAGAGIVR